MATGDLVTEDWQWELPSPDGTGYLIGGDEPVSIVSIDGLEDLPEIRSGDIPRPRTLGSFPLPQYPGERLITIEVEAHAAPGSGTTLRDVIDALAAATVPTVDEAAHVYQLPGTGKRRIVGRVRRRSLPVNLPFLYGVASGLLQVVATDPRVLANEQQSDSTGVGSVTGGLGFPHGFPHGFGTATAGTIAVTNAGNTPAAWTATLTGPLTSPRVSLVGGDGDLELAGFTLADGDTLELDSRERTVLLNGTASRANALTRRTWFDLPPGALLVQLGAGSGTGTLTVRWRSAWL